MTDSFNEIISILLQNLGSRKEIDQYLREFTKVGTTKFAVVKVGGGIIEDSLEELASSLAFLRQVGLFPIVMHGAGPQLNRAFQEAGLETNIVDGLRVTSPEALAVVRQVLQSVNFTLVDRLEAYKIRARPIFSGVFEATLMDETKWGLVGQVARVDLQAIEAAIQNGQLPIVSCLGETATGQIVNINADVAARELALAVKPYKVIFLTPTGGLLDAQGDLIPAVNLVEDFDTMMEADWLTGGMRLKLIEVKNLLDRLPPESSVSMTTPQHLATELFTHRGSGTLIRRGQRVETHTSFADVDTVRLRHLIESSFGRSLAADYFETRAVETILLTHDYSAAAIVTREEHGSYLDKFAVTAQAQGLGLGASLWSRLQAAVPRLFWRARPDNRIAGWYFSHAEGTHRTDEWIVFWYGLKSRAEIETCIDSALKKQPSLLETISTPEVSNA